MAKSDTTKLICSDCGEKIEVKDAVQLDGVPFCRPCNPAIMPPQEVEYDCL
jgi:formylmethanofuran dehydrogenase subunit E